ncbi:MAG: bifunctional UDP-N-acetylglucosamine diphosphorylase/glucosamine-1-phosphate N-acetyltransferase GlmU [Alphaproteobacteria bacterium]|nr:bifunctional UDP-N-acetylglucosamine diphosphorylase/glucosamine-1-phosphate N-acetyltransferase GlmU [Alphaproteobacteria bacterium]
MKAKAIILGAGQGTRMKSPLPKVMHKIAGRSMVRTLLDTLSDIDIKESVVVVGPDMDNVKQEVAPIQTVEQTERLGTGHAVKMASKVFGKYEEGCFFILFGDTPLISKETLLKMYEAFEKGSDIVVLGFVPENAGRYGRLIVEGGELQKIVEYKDATEAERAVQLCNSGVMCVNGAFLWDLISSLKNENAAKEYYLTDIVGLAREKGLKASVVQGENEELLGVNSRADLAVAEKVVQTKLRTLALEKGVCLIDPETVYFSYDTQIEPNVTIEPNVFFSTGVKVQKDVVIRAFSHLEDVEIEQGATIGPFARFRGGSHIGKNVHVGNFVEVKKSTLGENTKVGHLSYLGDALLAENINIGAGTITCNYDGYRKSKTEIGSGAFIGSDSVLIAPIKVGKNVVTGAGSVLSKDVPDDALAVTRPRLFLKEDGAISYHERKKK